MRAISMFTLVFVLTPCLHAQDKELNLEKDFAWLIGTWRGEIQLDREYEGLEAKKGQVMQEEESYAWGLDHKFIVLNRTLRMEGKEVASATDFIGYDPETKQIKQWGFYSTGGHGSGLWSRVDGTSMALTWSTIDTDGKKDSGRYIQKKIDDDTMENVTVERMVNGEKFPDTPKTKSRRVKK